MLSDNLGFALSVPLPASAFIGSRRTTCHAVPRKNYFRTPVRDSGFTPPFLLRRTRSRLSFSSRSVPIRCSEEAGQEENPEGKEEERKFVHKFDPNSETDAFGRDPRKETECWMDAARSVLDSDEVQQAVAEHTEKGGDGLTDEQREYMEFIKKLDESKGDT